jgi:hypothetical protein
VSVVNLDKLEMLSRIVRGRLDSLHDIAFACYLDRSDADMVAV